MARHLTSQYNHSGVFYKVDNNGAAVNLSTAIKQLLTAAALWHIKRLGETVHEQRKN
jgi:hypothetical protein